LNCILEKQKYTGKLGLSKEEILGKKPLFILEKIKENLERLK